MDFEEFCAASISVHQHESLDCWEQSIRHAYELFEMNGNRVIVIEELASVSLSSSPGLPSSLLLLIPNISLQIFCRNSVLDHQSRSIPFYMTGSDTLMGS